MSSEQGTISKQETMVIERAQTYGTILGIRSSRGESSSDQQALDAIQVALMTIEALCIALNTDEQTALRRRLYDALELSSAKARTQAIKGLKKDVLASLKRVRAAYKVAARAYAGEVSEARRVGDAVRSAASEILTGPQVLVPAIAARANEVMEEVNKARASLDAGDDLFEDNLIFDAREWVAKAKVGLDALNDTTIPDIQKDWKAARTVLDQVTGLKELIQAVRVAQYLDAADRAELDEATSDLTASVATKGTTVSKAIVKVGTLSSAFEQANLKGKQQYDLLKPQLDEAVARVNRYRGRMPREAAGLLGTYVRVRGQFDGREYALAAQGLVGLTAEMDRLWKDVLAARAEWRRRTGGLSRIDTRLTVQEGLIASAQVVFPVDVPMLRATYERLDGLAEDLPRSRDYVLAAEDLQRLTVSVQTNDDFQAGRTDESVVSARKEAREAVAEARRLADAAIEALRLRLTEGGTLTGPFEVLQRLSTDVERIADAFDAHERAVHTVEGLDSATFVGQLGKVTRAATSARIPDVVDDETQLRREARWVEIEMSFVHLMEQFELLGGTGLTPRLTLSDTRDAFEEQVGKKDWEEATAVLGTFEGHRKELMGQVLLLQQRLRILRQASRARVEDLRRDLTVLVNTPDKQLPSRSRDAFRQRVQRLLGTVAIHEQTLDAPGFCTQDIIEHLGDQLTTLEASVKALQEAVSAKSSKALKAALEPEARDLSWLTKRLKTLERVKRAHPTFQPEGVSTLIDETKARIKTAKTNSWAELTIVDAKYMQLMARHTRYMDALVACHRKGAEADQSHLEITERLKGDTTLKQLWAAYEGDYKAQKANKNPQERLPALEAVIAQQDQIKHAMKMASAPQKEALARLVAEADVAAEEKVRKHKQFKREHERLTSEISKPWYARLEDWAKGRKQLDYGGPGNLLKMAAEFEKAGKFDEAFHQLQLAQRQIDAIVESGLAGGEQISLDQLVSLHESWIKLVGTFHQELTAFGSWFAKLDEATQTQRDAIDEAIASIKPLFAPMVMGSPIGQLRGAPDFDARTAAAEQGIRQVHKYKEILLGESRIQLLVHCPIKGNPGLGSASPMYRTLDRLERNFHMARPAYKG